MTTLTKDELSKLSTSELLELFPTKSAAIRHLCNVGFTRMQVSKLLSIRYQHVRNVMITPVTTPKS